MVLVLALLGGSAAAFAVTEGLKLEKSPIANTVVDKVVAPDSATSAIATISFLLRKPDHLTVQIVNGNGEVIRTLARSRPAVRGAQSFKWNGRDDEGRVVAGRELPPACASRAGAPHHRASERHPHGRDAAADQARQRQASRVLP